MGVRAGADRGGVVLDEHHRDQRDGQHDDGQDTRASRRAGSENSGQPLRRTAHTASPRPATSTSDSETWYGTAAKPSNVMARPTAHAPVGRTHSGSYRRSGPGQEQPNQAEAAMPNRTTLAASARRVSGTAAKASWRGRELKCQQIAASASRIRPASSSWTTRAGAASRRALSVPGGRIPGLAQHPRQEHRVPEQVPSPHPMRLDRESEDPFESIVRQPSGRTRDMAGHVVEQCADGPHDGAVEAVSVAVHPELLLRCPHADEHDPRPVGVDVLDHPLVVGRVEVEETVVSPDDVQPRVPAPQPGRGLAGDRRLGAEQVDRLPGQLAQGGQAPDPVGPGHPVRNRHVEHAGGQPHAVAVAVDEVGAPQRIAQPRSQARLVDHVGVDVHHAPRLLLAMPTP